jgi:hypothetical protein
MLAVFDPRYNFPLGRAIALEFIGDDHARDIWTPFEELAEALLADGFIRYDDSTDE